MNENWFSLQRIHTLFRFEMEAEMNSKMAYSKGDAIDNIDKDCIIDRLVRYSFAISGKTLVCCFPGFICHWYFESTTNNSFLLPFCYIF